MSVRSSDDDLLNIAAIKLDCDN